MELDIKATPEELQEKSGDLVKAIGDLLRPVDPDLALRLEKALPKENVELRIPAMRGLQERTGELYEKQLEAMLKDIGKVLDKATHGGGA